MRTKRKLLGVLAAGGLVAAAVVAAPRSARADHFSYYGAHPAFDSICSASDAHLHSYAPPANIGFTYDGARYVFSGSFESYPYGWSRTYAPPAPVVVTPPVRVDFGYRYSPPYYAPASQHRHWAPSHHGHFAPPHQDYFTPPHHGPHGGVGGHFGGGRHGGHFRR